MKTLSTIMFFHPESCSSKIVFIILGLVQRSPSFPKYKKKHLNSIGS